eukprot:GHVS01024406.1.p3 GENE.GHVS01024406.1~~GHVS01024406.1.p3  ORF type:complete len:124 (-),score=18.73 GHVS01024406.1:270-641(-)
MRELLYVDNEDTQLSRRRLERYYSNDGWRLAPPPLGLHQGAVAAEQPQPSPVPPAATEEETTPPPRVNIPLTDLAIHYMRAQLIMKPIIFQFPHSSLPMSSLMETIQPEVETVYVHRQHYCLS